MEEPILSDVNFEEEWHHLELTDINSHAPRELAFRRLMTSSAYVTRMYKTMAERQGFETPRFRKY